MIRKVSAGDASELAWFKSSYSSGPDGDSCVEVAATPGTIHIRDSKNARGPRLGFAPETWSDFVMYASGNCLRS
ncbi:DUF397 domain-containing protein [Streptomyces sp. NPDC057623]|uniref:DUF397 domain-containing protein n=1 Tax=Streptomyces sp. NPDC057623 TaxID=3346187 RepID=UPI0036A54250